MQLVRGGPAGCRRRAKMFLLMVIVGVVFPRRRRCPRPSFLYDDTVRPRDDRRGTNIVMNPLPPKKKNACREEKKKKPSSQSPQSRSNWQNRAPGHIGDKDGALWSKTTTISNPPPKLQMAVLLPSLTRRKKENPLLFILTTFLRLRFRLKFRSDFLLKRNPR